MVLGSDKAEVRNHAVGETFKSSVYPVEIRGETYNIYDTVSLEKHDLGAVDSAKVVGNLYRLVTNLSKFGGIHLLVFVIKLGRPTDTMQKNYALFHSGFCDSRVPIVIVLTGCKNVELHVDACWVDSEPSFTSAGMSFVGHACVFAAKAKNRNEDLVQGSVVAVKNLIVQHCETSGWTKVCHLRPHSRKHYDSLKHFHSSPRLFGFEMLSDL